MAIIFKNASENNVFAFDANTITHNDKSLLTQDKANTLYAPIGDYALRTALNSYTTKTDLNNYVTTANANNTYLTKTDASNTYAKKTDLNSYATTANLNNYLTTANANSTYLSKADAASAYATQNYVSSQINELTNSVSTMLEGAAEKTELDKYVSKAGDNNVTGTINISKPAGLTLTNHIFESNPTNLVIKNKANQPILTVYPSVAYLNGREVLNQFKADQLYAPKSALNSYVTTDQYNNDMNSLLTALRNVNN